MNDGRSWPSRPLIAFLGGTVIPVVAGFFLVLMAIADSIAFEAIELKRLYRLPHVFPNPQLSHDFPTNFFFPFELGVIVLFLLAIPCLAASVWAVATGNSCWGRGATALSGLIALFLLFVALGTRYKMQQYASEAGASFYGSPTGTAETAWAAVLFLAGSLTCWLGNVWFRMQERSPGWESPDEPLLAV
jgi:hypothetical protein